MVEDFHSSGPNSTAEGIKKATCRRPQTTQSKRGERFDCFQREGDKEKRTTISRDKLTCFYTNTRSIVNKFEQLESYVHDLNPDIIGITESWASSHIFESELTIDGYDLFSQDRPVDRDGDGVCQKYSACSSVQPVGKIS